jgi:PTH2 family peptidyl-tRNA hydrolase
VDADGGEWRMVIAVRRDLDLGRGKLAAQAAHAAVTRTLDAAPDARDAWLAAGQPKIVVRVDSEEELVALATVAKDANLGVSLIHDAGRTQVAEGTPTACAVGPAPRTALDPLTGSLQLL